MTGSCGRWCFRPLVFPAMGTGFGQLEFDEGARQMAVAYAHYLRPPATRRGTG
ncbi:MAG TPA: hypothetical protein VM869_31835 [Enhygromyxa sp.]|nr:hypothetical protein [Enhygromyxa sp.]